MHGGSVSPLMTTPQWCRRHAHALRCPEGGSRLQDAFGLEGRVSLSVVTMPAALWEPGSYEEYARGEAEPNPGRDPVLDAEPSLWPIKSPPRAGGS